MKYIILILFLVLPGCATINDFFVEKNILATVLIKQAVIEYIDKSDDSKTTAARVISSISVFESQLKDNPDITTDGAIALFKKVIKYDTFDIRKKAAVDDVILISAMEQAGKTVTVDVPISIKTILFAGRQAAQLFL